MTKKAHRKTTAKKFRVQYAVTRSEWYEIAAANGKEAEDRAFSDGEFLDRWDSETTNVVSCEVEEIVSAGTEG